MRKSFFDLYYLVVGGDGDILRKQRLHAGRGAVEKAFMAEAHGGAPLLTENDCPACAQRKTPSRRFANPHGFEFSVCPDDGTVYMDPVPTEASLQRLYNDPAMSFHWLADRDASTIRVQPGERPDFLALRRMLGSHEPTATLLDVGCATGAFLLTAKSEFDVAGVEINDATAEVARRNGLNVTTGRLSDVPGENRFDVITMLQLIEHIVQPDQLLSDVNRLLKPGGYLYFNTPNIDSASFRKFGALHMHVSSFGHVSLYTQQALGVLARRSGLEMVLHEHCGGRDIALHDLVSYACSKRRFRHRMACYRPRLYSACNFIDHMSLGAASRLLSPSGHESYQRALFRKPR